MFSISIRSFKTKSHKFKHCASNRWTSSLSSSSTFDRLSNFGLRSTASILQLPRQVLSEYTTNDALLSFRRDMGPSIKDVGIFWPFLIPPPPCRNVDPDLPNFYLLILCNIRIWGPLKFSDVFYGQPLIAYFFALVAIGYTVRWYACKVYR